MPYRLLGRLPRLAVAGVALLVGAAACNSNGGGHAASTAAGQRAASVHGSGVPAPLAHKSGTVRLKVVSAHNATLALVPVTIDGKGPFVFALDTGASTSLVDTTVATQLGLHPSGQSKVAGVSCTSTVQKATLTHWSAGNVPLPKDTLTVTNLGGSSSPGGLQGLLGSDVLSQYGAVTVDYTTGELALGQAAGMPGHPTAVPLKVARAHNGATLALVPVKVSGKGPYAFALDTGAATSTLSHNVAQQLHLSLRKTGLKVTGVACSTHVEQTVVRQWSVADRQLPATTMDVVTFPSANAGLQGLLGSNILSTFGRITVDYAHGRLELPAKNGATGTPSAAGATGGGSVTITVARAKGAVVVIAPVRIDGHGPFTFVVDTGSPRSIVGTQVARQIGLTKVGSSGQVHGVQGSEKGYPAVVKSWQAGSVTLPRAHQVIVADVSGQHIQGLLGADVLSAFGRDTLDYRGQRLLLGSAVHPPQHPTTVPLQVDSSGGMVRVLVPVTIAGHQSGFALDTGASRSAVAQGVASTLGLRRVGTSGTVSGVASSGRVPLVRVTSWAVGSHRLPGQTLLDLPLQQQQLPGLLGSDVLSQFGSVTIEFGQHQLLLPAG